MLLLTGFPDPSILLATFLGISVTAMIVLGFSIPGAYSYGEPESVLSITTHFVQAADATAITAPLTAIAVDQSNNAIFILVSLFALLFGMLNTRTLVKKAPLFHYNEPRAIKHAKKQMQILAAAGAATAIIIAATILTQPNENKDTSLQIPEPTQHTILIPSNYQKVHIWNMTAAPSPTS